MKLKPYQKPSLRAVKLHCEQLMAASEVIKIGSTDQVVGNQALSNEENSIWDNNGSIWD